MDHMYNHHFQYSNTLKNIWSWSNFVESWNSEHAFSTFLNSKPLRLLKLATLSAKMFSSAQEFINIYGSQWRSYTRYIISLNPIKMFIYLEPLVEELICYLSPYSFTVSITVIQHIWSSLGIVVINAMGYLINVMPGLHIALLEDYTV